MIRVEAHGKTGVVILRDGRPDGSFVLLECTEHAPDGGGILGLPADEEEFPMLFAHAQRQAGTRAERVGKTPFTLTVDLSAMPSGQLEFGLGEFVERAVAESDSTDTVELTPENAGEWGLLVEQRGA